jgi:hypothetical protein
MLGLVDCPVKPGNDKVGLFCPITVTPAKAGIQGCLLGAGRYWQLLICAFAH